MFNLKLIFFFLNQYNPYFRGEIGLRITVIPFNYSKLYEDYRGFIKIICDGKERVDI